MNNPLSMQRSPVRLYTVASVLTAVVLALLCWHVVHSYWVSEKEIGKELRLKELAGTITYLDEVLTMSARMGAATGDLSWEQRYHQFEPKLGVVIQEANRMDTTADSSAAIAQVNDANVKLVSMEMESFSLTRRGLLAEARAILFSDEYEAQKWVYSQGLERFTDQLRASAEKIGAVQSKRFFLTIGVVIGVLPVLFFAWVVVFRTLRGWQLLLEQNNDQLLRQARELNELNLALDQKVAERAAELLKANEELKREVVQREEMEQGLREQAEELALQNRELNHRERETHSLLEALQMAKENLEGEHRTLEKVNEQLRELSVVKNEFVAKASHELRTPLTAIKEGVSLLLDGALGPVSGEQKDFLRTIGENVDRLTELINNMLDLSKIEAGRLRILRRRINVRELIESTLRSYKTIAGHRTLKADLAEVPPVFADPNRILQVLGNLFSNAVKFTRDGGTLTFALLQRAQFVSVSVSDDGVGIAGEDIPKLFQKFSQVGEGVGRTRGTGLGLALCKEMVELHGGVIEVFSEAGKGSAFTFTLPVYASEFALREGFRELVESARDQERRSVGLVVLDAPQFFQYLPVPNSGDPMEQLEQVAEMVRAHLHRGDLVLSVEPRWVVVLAVLDPKGLVAIMERICKKLSESMSGVGERTVPVRVGAALYPQDGDDVQVLLAKATEVLHQKFPAGKAGGALR